jgi:hypothetical protein
VYYVTEYIIRNLTLFRGCKKTAILWNNDNGEKVFVPEEKLRIGGKIKKKRFCGTTTMEAVVCPRRKITNWWKAIKKTEDENC